MAAVGGTLVVTDGLQLATLAGDGLRCAPLDPPVPPELRFSDRVEIVMRAAGDQLLIWQPRDGLSTVDAATGQRTAVPDPPRRFQDITGPFWTGAEVVVLDGFDPAGRAIAYDPAANRWRNLPLLPDRLGPGAQLAAVWTGDELVVAGVKPNEGRPGPGAPAVFATDGTDWRTLTAPALNGYRLTLGWTGRRVIAWDYDQRAVALADDGTWAALPPLPLPNSECAPQAIPLPQQQVLVVECGEAAMLDDALSTWRTIELPSPSGLLPTTVHEVTALEGGVVAVLGRLGHAPEVWAFDPTAPSAGELAEVRRDGTPGFARASVPRGWYASPRNLTPHLGPSPREVLTVATRADLWPGGSMCAHVPEHPIEVLERTDALVTFQQRVGTAEAPTYRYGEVPATPAAAEFESAAADCIDQPERFTFRWFSIGDGRDFHHVLMVVGVDAAPETAADALAIVNSFSPR